MDSLGLPTSFGRRNQRKNRLVGVKKPKLNYIVDVEVEEAFTKYFSFYKDKNFFKRKIYHLPEPSTLFQEDKWTLEPLQELKTALNNTKSKLNDLNLKEWHLHTTNTNVAGDVMKKLRQFVGPEFLTQAWCKMYECLWLYWLVPRWFKGGKFTSVHLCEAPGAFISALNHFLQTWYPDTQWKWLAATLNPYHESNPLSQMIQDDRFILHTLSNWTFGEDGTGNLMDLENLRHLQHQVETKLDGCAMLVTADGSIDCQTNPAEQESIVAPLHYCETFTALSILQPGGSLLIKMFTLLECESVCLLYLLFCMFHTVNVFKPVKSKEGNSEVYIICTEYIGKQHFTPWLDILYEKFGPTINKAMFAEKDIPEEFINQVYQCAKMFTELQMQVIERNLDLFYLPTPSKELHRREVKKKVAERYLYQYELQPIYKFIVGNDVLANTPTFNLAQKQEEGSFSDRLQKSQTKEDKSQVVEQLWTRVQELTSTCPQTSVTQWFMFNNREMPKLKLTMAKPVIEVRSSKFCNGRILEVFTELSCGRLLEPMKPNVSTSKVVDVGDLPWFTNSSHSNFMLVERLSRTLQDLPSTKSLSIQGLPLLTQFTVAMVFLLAHSFFQVGLSSEGNVILCGYQQSLNSSDWIQNLVKEMSQSHRNKAVLSLLPISVLCDPSYCTLEGVTFYLSVSSINNTQLLRSLETEVQRIKHDFGGT